MGLLGFGFRDAWFCKYEASPILSPVPFTNTSRSLERLPSGNFRALQNPQPSLWALVPQGVKWVNDAFLFTGRVNRLARGHTARETGIACRSPDS